MQNLKRTFIHSLKALTLYNDSLDLQKAIKRLDKSDIREGDEKEIVRFIWLLFLKYPKALQDPRNKKLITFCKSITASSLGLTHDKDVKPLKPLAKK